MAKIRCSSCRYAFELKPEKSVPKRCPYCAREGTLGKAKEMQQWIDETERASSQFLNG
jgi:PHP family Zn ribbon phosphoesterase